MARYSTAEIEGVMYAALKEFVAGIVTGGVYRFGCRPEDSTAEDAVIVCSSATADQIQSGFARVNVFRKDIADAATGALLPDIARLTEITGYAEDIINTLNAANTDFLFDLDEAPKIVEAPQTGQHFANISIRFNCITFNN